MLVSSHEEVRVLIRAGASDMATDKGADTAQILRLPLVELLRENDIVELR